VNFERFVVEESTKLRPSLRFVRLTKLRCGFGETVELSD
jgi:hypothetical protein